MSEINYVGVVVVTIGSFIVSSLWYVTWSGAMSRLQTTDTADDRMPPWKVLIELARSLIVAVAISILVSTLGITEWYTALAYSIILWLAFPAVLLTGSVVHDNVPWKLAAIHGGDWFIKLVLMTILLAIWNKG